MSAFFSSLEGKIIAALAVVILLLGGLGYWYFSYSQSQISTLTSNNAKLQTSISVDEKTIAAETAFEKIQSNQISSLQQAEQTASTAAQTVASKVIAPATITQGAQTSTDVNTLQTQLNQESTQIFEDLQATTKLATGGTK
jgi:hypothetical protein